MGYIFESALRSSGVLGFIGLRTLGFHLETAFREGHFAEAAAILYALCLLIASIKYWAESMCTMPTSYPVRLEAMENERDTNMGDNKKLRLTETVTGSG